MSIREKPLENEIYFLMRHKEIELTDIKNFGNSSHHVTV
jgi:hypothetical protein